MKKHLSLILLLTLLVSGCSQEELVKNQTLSSDGRKFTASFEQNESRTYIENGNLLRWTTGDLISLFNSNTLNQQYKFDGKTGDNSGTFSKVESTFGTGNDLNCHYAVYPYASDITITESGVITATLPAEQSYAANSFGLEANTMVAVTENTDDTFLKFKNVGGYLKLQLYGDDVTVKSITLTGNNNEKLAGKATITPVYGQDPTISMDADATGSVTLDCGNGVKIGSTAETATAFWIVAPPTTFENGFEVTITNNSNGEMTKSTNNNIKIERNAIKPMAAIELKDFIATAEYYVETAGTLASLIGDENKNILTNVKISGNLNATDIKYIREMAGSNYSGQITETGALKVLDISNATIVEEAEVTYLWDKIGNGQDTFQTEDNVIGPFMFFCTKLEKVILPTNITSISNNAFCFCENLKEITLPNGLVKIGAYAFQNCKNIASINLPESVSELGDNTFSSCSSLTSVNIPNNITTLNGTFWGCSSLESITIPNGVTKIGSSTFSYCKALTNIIIPNDVTSIGQAAFAGCSSLTSIIIPNNVTSIGDGAFEGCSSLTDITISNGVKATGYFTFSKCTSLTEITIPSSLTTMGNFSFDECESLSKVHVKSTTPPTGSNLFDGCSSELIIYVPTESIDDYQTANYWKDLNLLAEENAEALLLPDGPTFNSTVGDFMKSNNYSIKNIKFITNSNTTSESKLVTDENGTVGYLVANEESLEIHTSANKFKANPDCSTMFYCGYSYGGNFNTLISIELGDSFDTSNVTKMNNMFCGCSSLTSLDVSGFDTSNVTLMYSMFSDCSSLTSLDVSGFDTSNVTDMRRMFSGCSSLTSLDVSGFDTSNVTRMSYMFVNCHILTSLDVSGFNTSNVTDMSSIFQGCFNLTSLDVSGFETSNVTMMDGMFSKCSNLTSLDVTSFDTSNVTSMQEMFFNCSSLTSLDVSDFDTSAVTYINNMFSGCSSLTSLDVSGFDTSAVTHMYNMFSDCSSLTSLDVSGFDTSNVTMMSAMFSGCYSLTSLDVSSFNTSNVTEIHSMFSGCSSLTSLDLTSFSFNESPDVSYMLSKVGMNNNDSPTLIKTTEEGYSYLTANTCGIGAYAKFVRPDETDW